MRYDGILMAADIDGTLAVHGDISTENLEAIRYFTQNGGLFTLSTGRSFPYIQWKYGDTVAYNAPLPVTNGNRIVHHQTGEPLWQVVMDKSFTEVLKTAHQAEPNLIVNVHTTEGEILDSFNPADYQKGDYLKVVFIAQDAATIERLKPILIPKFPEFEFVKSWDVSLEVNNRKGGKGRALQFIKDYTNAQISIGVGNYENDFTLIQAADIGIAVADALPALRQMADRISVPAHQHAIADIVYNIEKFIRD